MAWDGSEGRRTPVIYGMAESTAGSGPGRGRLLAGAAAIVAIALALYLPWEHRPWDILDFSEFLPLLSGGGFGERLSALVRYYAGEHGRLNLAAYAALAAKWSWLGDVPVRWQWLRFGEMLAIVGGVYALARRLGTTPLGGWVGGILFVTTHAAAEAWMRQTMGEPLGLLCLLGAALLASGDEPAPSWWRGPAVALLTGLAVLSKEMLVVATPVVLAVAALRGPGGRLRWQRPSRAGWRMIGWITGAVVVTGIAVARTALAGSAAGFSASYGASTIPFTRLLANFTMGVLPAGWYSGPATLILPANLGWLVLVALGIRAGRRLPDRRAHLYVLLALALGLPALGALAYLPWPYFNLFYALPWLLGPALLLAECVSLLRRSGRWERVVAGVAVAVLVGSTAATAGRTARGMAVRQQVNGALVRALPRFGDATGLIVAATELPQQAWQGTGPTLVRYARAVGEQGTLPPARDVACREVARAVAPPGRWIIVSYSDRCGALAGPTLRFIATYHYLDWFHPGIVTDSLEADLLDHRSP